MRNLRRIFILLGVPITFICLGIVAQAQGGPTPSSHSFSENLARMTLEAARLLPYYIYEVERPLIVWFVRVAQLLAAAIVMTAFLRLLRQHQGGSFDLGWWFSRVAVCIALITLTNSVINFGTSMGNAIAYGTGEGNSWLNTVRRAQQETFNDSYAKFQKGTFTVRVHGNDLPVNPNPDPDDPSYGIIGVLYDREAKLEDVANKMDVSSWSMSTLFSTLSFGRGVMEFGDFILLIIRSFLLIGVRLLAPFMVALAIDREHAKQSAYKFAWGVAVLTLVFPAVAQIIRIMAYTAGNIALALGDSDPLYIWDKATMTAVLNPTANPVFVIVVMSIVMFIAGVGMIFTPLLSWKIVMGEMYQAVSNVVSGVTGGIISTGVGVVSAQAAAAVNKQAEMTQVQGQADAQTATVTGRRDAANLSAKGNEVASIAAARGSMVSQLASIEGARRSGVMQASSAATLGRETNLASMRAANREAGIQRDQSVQMTGAQASREAIQAAGESKAAKKDKWSSPAGAGAVPVAGAPIVDGGISLIGESSITTRNRAANEASTTYANNSVNIQNSATDRTIGSQQEYAKDVHVAYNRKEGSDIAAANTQASIASGGAVQGTNITIGGITAKHSYDMRANQTEYNAGMKAVEITKTAGEESAHLRHLAQTISAAGSIVANQSSNLFRELRF